MPVCIQAEGTTEMRDWREHDAFKGTTSIPEESEKAGEWQKMRLE